MLLWLAGSMLVAVALVAARASCTRRGIVVDHVLLFSIGFAVYWISPVLFGLLGIMREEPMLRPWFAFFTPVAASGRLLTFLIAAFGMYAAFVLGSAAGAAMRAPRKPVLPRLPFAPGAMGVLLLPAAALTAMYAWRLRGELFTGYVAIEGSTFLMRGTLTATSLILFGIAMLHMVARDTPDPSSATFSRLFRSSGAYWAVYFAVAVLVVSLGGRLYLLSTLAALVVYASTYRRPLGYRSAIVAVALAVIAAGALGVVRLGSMPSAQGLMANLAAEPLLTSFSLLHFAGSAELPWFAWPRFLLSDLLNLVPSAVLPNKTDLLMDPRDYGYTIFSPGGALSAFFSITINFGLVGALPALFLLGFSLSRLRQGRSPVARVAYAMLASWMTFTFHRDPFSTSVIKNMLEFSLLVPWIAAAAAHVLTVVAPLREAPTQQQAS